MENILEAAEEISSEAKENLEPNGKKTPEGAGRPDGAARKWERSSAGVRAFCRARPLQALALGAGTGALLGILLVKAFGRRESPAEKGIRNALHAGEEKWSQLRDGAILAARGARSIIDALKGR